MCYSTKFSITGNYIKSIIKKFNKKIDIIFIVSSIILIDMSL